MWLAGENKLSFIESAFQSFLSGQCATRATVGTDAAGRNHSSNRKMRPQIHLRHWFMLVSGMWM